MHSFLKRAAAVVCLVLAMAALDVAIPQTVMFGPDLRTGKEETSPDKPDDDGEHQRKDSLLYPTEWIQQANHSINALIGPAIKGIDTTEWDESLKNLSTHERLISAMLSGVSDRRMNLNELFDLEAQSKAMGKELFRIQDEMREVAMRFSGYYETASGLNREAFEKTLKGDTALGSVFEKDVAMITVFGDSLRHRFAEYLKTLSSQQFENRKMILKNDVTGLIIDQKIRDELRTIAEAKEPFIWNMFSKEYADFGDVMTKSVGLVMVSCIQYLGIYASSSPIIKLLFLCIAFFPYFHIRKQKKISEAYGDHLPGLGKHPVLIGIIFYFLLIYLNLKYSPYIIQQVVLLLSITIGSFIIMKILTTKRAKFYFLLTFVYYLLITSVDFASEHTVYERVLHILSIVPLMLIYRSKEELISSLGQQPGIMRFLVYFLNVNLLLGFVTSVIGYTTPSQLFISAGLNSFFLGMLLIVLVTGLIDYVLILIEIFNKMKSAYRLDFGYLRIKLRTLLLILAGAFWFVQYLVDINSFSYLQEVSETFLTRTRNLGEIEFTWGTVLVFGAVLYLAYYISSLIKDILQSRDEGAKTNAAGVILVLRLFVVGFGFIIALAAAGIPLDKVTIFVSALSVGIAFGLQNVINNLVSGIIIAFERPFKVGDILEIEQTEGKVSELGIRSSTILTNEGAELIVPNGEFISKKVINWTRSDTTRVERIVLETEGNVSDESVSDLIARSSGVPELEKEISGVRTYITGYVSDNRQTWTVEFRVSDIVRADEIRSGFIRSIKATLESGGVNVIRCE